MTTFLLIRHALNNTVGERFAGRMPGVDLNPEGRMQADQLAERLAGLPITCVYTSPLQRAAATARPIADILQVKLEIADDFTELDMGEWTGRSFSDLENDEHFGLFNQFRSCTRPPGGESMIEAQSRMVTGIEKLRTKHGGENIAIVSHADPIKAAVGFYAGIPIDLVNRLEISPASVSIIELWPETVQIKLINDTGGR